jgi:hypothetical protein
VIERCRLTIGLRRAYGHSWRYAWAQAGAILKRRNSYDDWLGV